MPRLRHILAPLVALTAALAVGVPSASAAACANTDVSASNPAAADATLCLLNKERTSRGLGALTRSAVLDKAADKFAADMVEREFFDHVSPGGGTFMDRIKAAGWLPSGSWTAGENIAWGSGSLATPESIVDGWMHSPGHRANILNGAFTQIGIGIADGAPQDGIRGEAGTYVNDFTGGGTKKRAAKRARRASKHR
ncbi:CAP domain-containing protein [Baekduia sp. Peel2402]|uniref:CAP domain-containing protein n=1 Tax=Baekduia sp. Peel2402 TaxID=3458296 RepID=UPI00403E82BE